jgi:hypothetical protein
MTMKKLMPLLLLMTIGHFATKAQSGSSLPIHRVVMQLSSNDTLVWKGLMNNLKNMKAGWGDSVVIEVVAHGPGIELLNRSKTTQAQNISKFKAMGIRFFACENTMREKGIPKDALITDAEFVRMGIGHIVLRQENGWSYIKTGF